jgi:hypothetical protein
MSTSSTVSDRPVQTLGVSQLNKSVYPVDQQVKFIHLQAEVDCLLQQLQNLQKQKLVDRNHDN